MLYSDDTIEEVRSRNDIVEVISGYIKLQKKGSTYFGLCPFHNEKTPSFSVSRDKQMYYCFGCGAGGNAFTFIMEYENYSFPEAVKYLAERAGMELPDIQQGEEERRRSNLRKTIMEINKQAAQYFYMLLKNPRNEIAHTYLTKRGLSEEIITAFGLGYAPKNGQELYHYLKSRGYGDDVLMKTGLFSADEKKGAYCKFWNRVMYPIMDINNHVIGFGGRVMGQGEPKYLNSPETAVFDKSRNLYGLNVARRTKLPYFLLCEGYMDVISLHMAGFTNAVAALGTAFTSGHASLIRRYVKEVYLTFDSDGAGTKAALRALPILKEAGLIGRIIRMEPYKDPDELIQAKGHEAFEKRIAEARNGFMFSLEVQEQEYNLKTPEGKTEFMKEAARRLTEFEEEIERNNYIEAVAAHYHVGTADLRKLVAKTAIAGGQARPLKRPEALSGHKKKEDGVITAQKILLTWMADNEGVYKSLREYLGPEDFADDLYKRVVQILYAQYESGTVNPARIMNYFTAEEEHKEVASLFQTKVRELTTRGEQEKAIRDSFLKVKTHSLEEQTRALDPTDIKGLQALMEQKTHLQNLNRINITISDR